MNQAVLRHRTDTRQRPHARAFMGTAAPSRGQQQTHGCPLSHSARPVRAASRACFPRSSFPFPDLEGADPVFLGAEGKEPSWKVFGKLCLICRAKRRVRRRFDGQQPSSRRRGSVAREARTGVDLREWPVRGEGAGFVPRLEPQEVRLSSPTVSRPRTQRRRPVKCFDGKKLVELWPRERTPRFEPFPGLNTETYI